MAEKKKKGILSQIKAASQDTPTMLTGPEPVQGGRTTQKIGALQNILGSRKTQTSGLSTSPKVRKAQLGAIFDNYIKAVNNYTAKYQAASKKLNKQKIYSTDARTGLSLRQKRKPNMLAPGEWATEQLQKLNKLEKHTFTGGTSKQGQKYPDITVSNKDMRHVTQHLARQLQILGKSKGIRLGGADKSVLERLSADVVLSDTGEVTRGGKLSGKDWHITSNIDDVNVPGLMIEDTNYGNILKGEEGGRAGEALHAEERSVTGSGEAYNRSQIPGNPKVPYKGVSMHLKPKEARKLKSDQASSLSSVKPGSAETVSGKIIVEGDQFNEYKPDKYKGKRISFKRPENTTFSKSILTAPISELGRALEAKQMEGQKPVQSGWQAGVDRLISGDPITSAVRDPETGYLVEADTRTEIEEAKYLSTEPGEKRDVEFRMSEGDIEDTNRRLKKTLLTQQIQEVKSTQGQAAADKFELSQLMEEQMDEMQNWKGGKTPGSVSGGGVWEMEGGYNEKGDYVYKGAQTKVNPPSPLEGFDKTRAANLPPGPWKSGYVLQTEGMHKPATWEGKADRIDLPDSQYSDLPDKPRKPSSLTDLPLFKWAADKFFSKKVKSGQTTLKQTPQSTLLTSKDPVPTYDQWETDWQEAPGRESHVKRKEGQPTVVSKKRQPSVSTSSSQVKPGADTTVGVTEWASGERKLESTSSESMEGRKLLYQDTKPNKRGVKVKIYEPIKTNTLRAVPYLGLGIDIIQGLRVMKDSKKSKKEFNLGSFIPAWAKKIAYGESIPRS